MVRMKLSVLVVLAFLVVLGVLMVLVILVVFMIRMKLGVLVVLVVLAILVVSIFKVILVVLAFLVVLVVSMVLEDPGQIPLQRMRTASGALCPEGPVCWQSSFSPVTAITCLGCKQFVKQKWMSDFSGRHRLVRSFQF